MKGWFRMQETEDTRRRSVPAGPGLWLAGVLLVSGVGGWWFKQAIEETASAELVSVTVRPEGAAAEGTVWSVAAAELSRRDATAPASEAARDAAPVAVPPNPFLPSQPTSAPDVDAASTLAAEAADTAGTVPVSAGAAEAGEPRHAGTPEGELPVVEFPADLVLTGVIQGEPALAVVRRGEQTAFLKIGDTVADTWRLDEIHERSVVFRSPNQSVNDGRVEIPLRGGSSQ